MKKEMKIPSTYYIRFWFINSIMAVGTGIIMGLVAWRAVTLLFMQTSYFFITPLYFLLIIPICFLIVYQFFLLSFFWGKHRGEFEYTFLDKLFRGNSNYSKSEIVFSTIWTFTISIICL